MRHLLFIAIIIGAGSVAVAPAKAALLRLPSLNGFNGERRLRKSVIGGASTDVMATLHPTPTIRRHTATIRLLLHTPIRRLCMAINHTHQRMPILHPSTIRHLRPPRVEAIHPQKVATATIRPQLKTTHRLTERPAIIRRMALRANSQCSKGRLR